MATRQEVLKRASQLLADANEQKRREQEESLNDDKTLSILGPMLAAEQVGNAIKENKLTAQEIATAVGKLKIPKPEVNVSVPDVIVPEITVPKPDPSIIPDIKLPDIVVPEPKVTVNVEKPDIPVVNVPKPEVTVNVPKQPAPKVTVKPADVNFPTKMSIGATRSQPLPVTLYDPSGGKPHAWTSSRGGSAASTVEPKGVVSEKNSSTEILAGDAVFTGEGEDVSNFASVSILYKSDVAAAASGLKIEFSQDNTNWDVSLVGDLGAKTFQVHRLVPAARFFRVVYTNGSAAQSSFRLQCIFHTDSTPVLITRAGQPQSTVDATPTRQTAEIDLDFARKHIPGGRAFFFFGHNDDVGTSYEDIWPGQGDINWLEEAVTVEVSSSNAADTSAGIGTRSVELHGLSSTGADQDEVIVMAGTSTTESANTYTRVNKMHNETVGTYGGSHEGDISAYSRGGATEGLLLAKMVGEEGSVDTSVQYGIGEASNAFWTVPLDKVLYITDLSINVQASGNKTADIILYEREGILDVTAPMDPRRIIWNRFDVVGAHTETFKSHIKIKNLTDLFFRAKAASSGTRIDAKLHFYLVDKDASGA